MPAHAPDHTALTGHTELTPAIPDFDPESAPLNSALPNTSAPDTGTSQSSEPETPTPDKPKPEDLETVTSVPNALICGIDVMEEAVRNLDPELLDILLSDRTLATEPAVLDKEIKKTKNDDLRKRLQLKKDFLPNHAYILWCTRDYEDMGTGFEEFAPITPELVTGVNATLIQPRIAKEHAAQSARTRSMAEVFTPSWICNKQNNLVDEQWFRRKNVFNLELDPDEEADAAGLRWEPAQGRISFEGARKGWKKYVDAQRLEISCGEAPYLVSRYDTVTGLPIPLEARIGLLDRKMRIVGENVADDAEWIAWSQRAYESVYGYEYQGDSLLLARENLLYSYIEYYRARFQRDAAAPVMPPLKLLKKIALIIAWNIWQMDGLKCVVPNTCRDIVKSRQGTLLASNPAEPQAPDVSPCPGCAEGDIHRHNGVYCKIQDWRFRCPRRFKDMMKGVCPDAR